MDLRRMEYFVAVIDHGGMTKAANALYIAQPSLSQTIRSLEREVGVQLFDRSGRKLELTAAGRTFEDSARRVLRDTALARSKVAAVRELRAGRLEIAATGDLNVDPLPRLVSRLCTQHPGIEVRISDPGTPAAAAATVRMGEAEIALTTLPVKADALTVRSLGSQRMVLAMTAELAADLPDPLPQSRIGDVPLIREPDDCLPRLLADPELAPPVERASVQCAHRQTTWDLVTEGAGAALLPEQFATTQLPGVELRALTPDVRRELGLVYRADQLSPAAAAFLAVVESVDRAT
ncbi:LysR family transcriptional regulator [Streptomyces sp. NPDC050145]|uniref:LysR family transcriptional regulator n=1 Tax=Streptomyces sp. NPDC050145 TaxID=3365602 RepID=UPI0037AB5D77